MAATTSRRTNLLSKQAMELGIAAPQVIVARLARLAMAGANPSARDRHECYLMGAEKAAAFGEAWLAMSMRMLQANQQLMLSLMFSWNPLLGGNALARSVQAYQSAMLDVLGKGLAPVHKCAVANAKRLRRR
ncbi:polyhydroxyalkanoate granule-associated phasin [Azotobacter bryophylli]|uniref:Polyhydroxyalkanoate granule-associated phasin n=1 Tax=Azotobacter bryophylli TaxID=1986537 RepID=A0ABV7B050_9GAMM